MKLEEIQNIEIILALDEGKTISETAKDFDVSVAHVRQLAIAGGLEPEKTPKKKKTQLNEELAMEQIREGESLKQVAQQFQITTQSLKLWCLKNQVEIPRDYRELNEQERHELRELLEEEEDVEEVRRAYQISNQALEELCTPAYKKLEPACLSFLFEILREDTQMPPARIRKMAQELGMNISKEAIYSYQNRLKTMGMF